ncbi:penicillin-binding protein 2 [Zophobihabitans entericus]|uniref:Peptidoglycan D,D-transpeptidase MrdA n=1 Tax=Zophobihabitans entericus TaxID=1635327 RepID=A0A6G9IDM4_9GAMM|nr:penicillin-binding protein 2 [Zophobihabitans entericus]
MRDHSAEANLFLRRAVVAFVGILVLVVILLATLGHLQISRFGYYSTRSNENRINVIPIPPNRGIIYDRNHIPLAINNTIYKLEIIPDKIKNLNEQLEELKTIVDLTDEEIDIFQKERRNYRSYSPVPLKAKLTEQQIAQFVVNQHRFPFVSISGEQHRYYPYGATLTHILGYVSKINDQDKARLIADQRLNEYVGTSNIGKLGIERFYESTLHGMPGYEEVEVDSRGRIVRQLDQYPPQVGQDIYLSIDLKLQQYIEKLLNGRRAAVVALDPNNGEVLALVSSPSYDPNLFVGGISGTDYNALLTNPNKPLFNRAMQGTYPPASTVKPFIAAAALTEGVITRNTVIHDVGWWQLPNTDKRYRDWKRWGHGRVDVIRSIESSVDTFYYQIAYDMGIDRLSKWMTEFGFGDRTGIDISQSEESRAIMPNREWKFQRYEQSWLQGDTIPVGIGQGYWTATPLQMANALTILINNGKSYTPHILLNTKSSVIGPEVPEISVPMESTLLNTVDAKSWQAAKEGMYKVLYGSLGTARHVFAKTPYQAAGKSGTAQVYGLKADEVYDANNIPEHLRDHALFIAYAPYDKPKIAIAIVLENGGSGSTNGGAVARRILDYYLLGDESVTTDASILKMRLGD